MKTEMQTEINGTLTELLQLLSTFDQEQINVIPFEGSWTAGQLAKHLIMSGSGLVELMNGAVRETEREPDEHIQTIKTVFLDFSTKLESPDFVKPPMVYNYNKVDWLSSLKDIKAGINQAIETLDLTKTCVAFEIPVLGFLTRLEAIHFVLYHTQRHIQQLKKIFRTLVNNNSLSLL